ncbi:TlpA family protein disulfide reductase [Streptomyces sp. TN58]|uniref:TlpA family protein disulfide reductase n=1 Tax=Streptomyces sp. TN58 TaxID=234612 RepID=UPI0009504C78|nr:TlpA disulfide reductase family protein [Streptomyces sp. TN58]APU41575.1 redoxin domain-containing protein [Streptomyces sp. TN58]
MSLSRAPRRRSTSGRALLLTAVTVTGALTLTACDGSDSGKPTGSGGNYVTGASGISTAAKGERSEAPGLDGETVDGKALDTAALKGKVVVLNVWGSWCPPCRAEAPAFAKVSKEFTDAGKDVVFVGLNVRDYSKQNAASFEETFGVPYPSLYDPDGKLLLRFPKGSLSPNAIPSTLVLDREGKIAARTLAPLGEDQLRSMIDPVLAEQ